MISKETQNQYLLKFDEINQFTSTMWISGVTKKKADDYFLDFLIDAYLMGYKWAEEDMGLPSETPDNKEILSSVNYKIDGITPKQRLNSHYDDFDTAGINNTLSTEYHRIFNEGAIHRATKGGATQKTWYTMEDNKVRETHIPLDGVTVGINEDFTAGDGDKAQAPGGFSSASNNCNCRCSLAFA